jgi:Peptidase family C25
VTTQRKDRSLYVSSILNGDAENWFGAVINRNGQTVQNLTVNKLDTGMPARLSVRLQGTTTGEHIVSVKFNDVDLGTVNYFDRENREFEFDVPAASLIEGANSVRLQSVGTGNDVSFADTAGLSYSRRYEAVDNKLRFSVAAGQTARVNGFSTGKIAVYEIQNGQVSRQIAVDYEETEGGYGFGLGTAGYDREFMALSNSQPEQAVSIDRNAPSGWNTATNKADFVIIAPARFQNQANSLAELRMKQGLETKVVLAEDVADEFGSGVLTSDALRGFLQNAAENWRLKPRYALLFGDSTFDPRNYLAQENRNLVPTRLIDTVYMETSSDSWLADFNGDGVEDVALGRLPAANEAEADLLLAKIFRFESQSDQADKSSVMVTDRGFELFSDGLQAELPDNVKSIRIDRLAMTDPEMRSAILSQLNDNPMVVTYTGHGSTGVWSSTAIFSNVDAASLNNSRLSIYLLMTCMNGFSNNTSGDSLAEAALKAEGGAIAVWASSGVTPPEPQFELSQSATRIIFNAKGMRVRIGDVVVEAKSSTVNTDVRRTWQLLGDPTLFVK